MCLQLPKLLPDVLCTWQVWVYAYLRWNDSRGGALYSKLFSPHLGYTTDLAQTRYLKLGGGDKAHVEGRLHQLPNIDLGAFGKTAMSQSWRRQNKLRQQHSQAV